MMYGREGAAADLPVIAAAPLLLRRRGETMRKKGFI